ncbi:MAG TPA: DNA-directed RNA polymerase subunit beta [Clostridiales bacterium]|nr:MAG: DNA-directed RNA polymerase subunit beta [Clostridiales bacterium GWD2_32_59]HAN09710.1 DNA-directed RNA polymerase subunit beta [Clostridiales bacterium]
MEKIRIKPVKTGNVTRMSYIRKEEVVETPDFIEIQKQSYEWLVEEGLKEVFDDVSPIIDYNNNLVLEFLDFQIEKDKIKYNIEDCKARYMTYAAPLRVKVRLLNKETQEIKEQNIFIADFPLMTENGSFIINGAERVIVSQLVRSPGIYYNIDHDKLGKQLITATVIPNRGAWLEYETDSKDVFYARVDRTRKLPVTCLIRALGVNTDEEIKELFGEDPKILATLEKDVSKTREEGLIEIYKKLRPGEPPTVDSAESLFTNMMYDDRRYDLAKVGRYKFNKKLALKNRVVGFKIAETVASPLTGEIIIEENQVITEEIAEIIQDSGIHSFGIFAEDRIVKILSNMTVDINKYLDVDVTDISAKGKVYLPVLKDLIEKNNGKDKSELYEAIKNNMKALLPIHITVEDILASINYTIHLEYGVGIQDDIDHLGNRRIRCAGELLQNQIRIGFTRTEKVIRERMNLQNIEIITPQVLINTKPISASIKEFFGSSQLSQFMQQNNPLDALTHKRRLSALGPGGLSRERAGFEVRDVHYTHFGRMCPVETPEGPNIGLINSLAIYARINEYGFIETPYRRIDRTQTEPKVTLDIAYFTADEEEKYVVVQANEPLNEDGTFKNEKVTGRYKKEEFIELSKYKADLMEVSPQQMFSVATAMIPFLENDDANRALMGSNMQRQSVPLIKTESPIIGTGLEYDVAIDSGVVIVAREEGIVTKTSANEIIIKNINGQYDKYELLKFKRSNQTNCINQIPIVDRGQKVKKGEAIADGPSTKDGEIALGKNILIGFMTWEGYNYEDAILLNEKLVQDDVYTSIHIEEYEMQSRDTKLGPEDITRDIPNIAEDSIRDLDEKGIIRIGAEVLPGDILVGKVTPKGETELTAEERLLRAIFGEKAREVRDTSLRVPHGQSGIILDVHVFTKANGDELPPGVNEVVRVYIAQKRKISVGDKMAGRHGNKGVVSRVLPTEDMPYLPNGRALDIVLNPLGVPSRMNIGQVLEVHLGLAAKALGIKVATPVFNGAKEGEVVKTLEIANDYVNSEWNDFIEKWKDKLDDGFFEYLDKNKAHREEWKDVPINANGKIMLRDGRTGEEFDNPVTVGYMHYLKLHHLVDDKIHARSTGPYSLVTQQPLGGKAQFGGQRFGEMEVWALEAYGAAYTLQELLTVKSDDVIGRVRTYEAIVKGENIPKPGIPESFKVLLKELQALCLDITVYDKDREFDIRESVENDDIEETFFEHEAEKRKSNESDDDDDELYSVQYITTEELATESDDINIVDEKDLF